MIRYSSVVAVAVLLALSAGCRQPAVDPLVDGPGLTRILEHEVTVIDLTHALSHQAPYWPDPAGNPFQYTIVVAQPSGHAAMGRYATPEHFGTHLDAPVHSHDGLPGVDELGSRQLFGPAVVVDVREHVAVDPDYVVRPADLRAWETDHGRIPAGAVVLINSGWASRWPDQAAYANQDAAGAMHFPGFGPEAATWLVRERDIRGIGVDTFSVDPAAADGFPVHGIVNGAGKYHLENVAAMDALPAAGAYLIVAPIKIEGGSGGQVRIFALVPHRPAKR